MSEQEIRTLMRQNYAQGCRALFDAYYSYVYAVVFRRLAGNGTREDAEECVIDVFTEVIERLPGIQEGSLRAYIGTAAKHKAINLSKSLAAGRRYTATLDEAAQLPSGEDVAEQTENAERSRLLMDCILSLGEPDSTIIIQKFYYGHSAEEIARITGRTAVTVRVRCSRAVKRLRTLLTDRGFTL